MSSIDEPNAWHTDGFGQHLKVSTGRLELGKNYDTLDVTYPTTSTEQYLYSLGGSTVLTILVTYSDATKEVLTTVEVL